MKNAHVGETEDTFLAPPTCISSVWTNQRPRVVSIDQSEDRTESTACGECHTFLGRDILGSPSGRGFSEAGV